MSTRLHVCYFFMATFGWNKARLEASGQKSFDNDPGWPDIKNDLLPPIPIATRRAWLREKRDTGTFDNHFPNDVPHPLPPGREVKKTMKVSKNATKKAKSSRTISSFFPGRTPV